VTVMTERHILRIHFHLPDASDADVYERLVEQLHGISPRTQALPPADADCDVTGALRYYGRTPYELAQLIQLRALALYGIATTIGSAGNRMLAAMAADATAPGGISHLDNSPEAIAGFLRPRPTGALYGVGPATANLLARHGLHTIGTAADTPPGTLQRLLGKTHGRLLHERARGIDDRSVVPQATARSCSADHVFDRDELDPDGHRQALLGLTEHLGTVLRTERQIARRLTLTVRYADRTATVRTRTLTEPTHHTAALTRAAYDIYATLALQRARVRGIALRAEDLQSAERATTQLTFDPGDDKRRRIEAAADKARARFGPAAVIPATTAIPGTPGPCRSYE
jgi:DNA polymerase IV